MNPIHIVASTFLLASTALAQLVGPGLQWQGSTNFAGSFIPSCQDLPVVMLSPDTVTVKVWGDQLAPFGLFASTSGSQCIQLPGILGGVILDFPIVALTGGLLSQTSPCLSCPPGVQPITFAVPPGLPLGTSLALQAVTIAAGNLSLTVAITGTV